MNENGHAGGIKRRDFVKMLGGLSAGFGEVATHYTLRSELILLVVPLSLGLLFKSGWKCL